jgi:hypothetical protein
MSRRIRHLTPRYIWNRSLEKIYRWMHPDVPWLTKTANTFLETYLQSSDCGWEYGSGKSTIWFARRVKYLTSVEHDPRWFERVSIRLDKNKLLNVDYLLRPREPGVSEKDMPAYVQGLVEVEDESLDFIIIDGIFRDHCALIAQEKIKPNGILIIDNANLFLPCRSHSPNSRSYSQGPKGEKWSEFLKKVSNWRYFWTSNGVSDTVIYFKPGTMA